MRTLATRAVHSNAFAPGRVAAALAVAIALLAFVGIVVAWSPRPALAPFDLDGERTVPAALSSLLLFIAAALALLLPASTVRREVALAFGVLLVLAGLDEAIEIHERLEQRSEIDWQVLYVPIFAAVMAVWVMIVLGLRSHRTALALALGSAACWTVSQFFEALQWDDDGPAPGYTWMVVCEEVLEMTGSALLLVALLLVVRESDGGPAVADAP